MNQITSICAHQAFIYIQNCLCAFLSAFQSINSSMLLATHLSIHPSVCPSRHLSNWTHPINNSDKAIRHIHQKRWQLVGISHPFLFLLPCPNLLHLPSLPSTIQLLFSFPQESYRNENEMASGVERGVNCLVTAWLQGQMNTLALSKVQGSPRSKLMDSLTCGGWNQLKYIKSRIHAFSEWQICAGNWERRREKNVFDLLETGCSFRQGSQAWSEMRSWWIITAKQPP